MSYDLGTAHGKIELDYEGGRAAAEADEDVRKVGDSSEEADGKVRRFGESLSKFASVMGRLTKSAALGAAAISTMVHSGQLLAGVMATLAAIGPAAFGALPGVILVAASALAVFKAATSGVSDALAAATGDAAKFNEALEKLSPQARAFAVAWRDATKALKPMQQAIQDAFFSGLGPQVTRIATGVGSLRNAAVGVANAFNALAREALNSIKDVQFEQFESILLGTQQALRGIAGGLKPVIQGFISLGQQASEFAGQLGEGIGGALTRLGNAMQNFDLEQAFNDAMAVLRPLGQILQNVGSIVKSVFGGMTTDAGGALGVFAELTGKLADFLKTAEGQAALQALGQAMAAISGAAGEVFLALLKELAPTIVALAPGLAELALQMADVLVPAIEAAGPLLQGMAQFLSDNMDIIGPIVIALGGLAIAVKAYNAAMVIANAATKTWGILTGIASAATKVWTGIQAAFNIVMMLNPIGLIILAIGLLIAAIILIATKTDWFQRLWKVIWTAIKDAAKAVADWFMNTLVPALKGVVDKVAGFFRGLKDAIVNRIGEAISFVKGFPGKILSAIGNIGAKLFDKGKEFVRGFIDGIGSMVGQAVQKVKDLVSAVTDFLPGSPAKKGPLSGRGWTPFRGKALVEGFAEGMAHSLSLVEKVGVKVASVAAPVVPTMLGSAGVNRATLPIPTPPRPAAQVAGETITIQNLSVTLQGVWDMRDPQSSRRIAADIFTALEEFKKGYR